MRTDEVRIVTSLDGPYKIPDVMKDNVRVAQKYLLISAPWVSKTFIDSLRDLVAKDVSIYVLTRLPEKGDWNLDRSFFAIDSLLEVAEGKGWKVSVKCNPCIHAKFIVIDDATCLFTTSNPTDSGMYYNHEILIVLKHPYVRKYSEFFFKVWERLENVSWEQVRRFYGYKTVDSRSVRKEIAEKIISFCMANGNSKVLKWKVCKEIQKLGFDEHDIITVAKDLVNDGILYEPDYDSYRMANEN